MSVSFSELYIHDMFTDSYSVCDRLDVMSPQNWYFGILTSSVIVLRGGNLQKWSGQKDEVLMNGISALLKGTPNSSLFFLHHVKIQGEVSSLQPTIGSSPEPNHADTLILDFQSLKMWEINVYC